MYVRPQTTTYDQETLADLLGPAETQYVAEPPSGSPEISDFRCITITDDAMAFLFNAAAAPDFDGEGEDFVNVRFVAPGGASFEEGILWSEGTDIDPFWESPFPLFLPTGEFGTWTVTVFVRTESGDSNTLTCEFDVVE